MLGDSGRRPSAHRVARVRPRTAAAGGSPPSSPRRTHPSLPGVSMGVPARPARRQSQHPDAHPRPLPRRRRRRRRPGAPAVWVDRRSCRHAPGFAVAQRAAIDRIAGATTAGSRRLVAPVSSARREAPFGGGRSRGGWAGRRLMFGNRPPSSIRRRRREIRRRARGAKTRWRASASASTPRVRACTSAPSRGRSAGSRASPLAPAGLPRRAAPHRTLLP